MRSERIAVVGGGTMGVGIVYIFALAGFDVTLVEPVEARVAAVRQTLAEVAEGAVKRGKIAAEDARLRINAVRYLNAASDLPEGLDLVIETVPERIEIKRDVLQAIDRRRPKIIASNTSALSIDTLAETVSDPSRFLGMHFFNPVWSLQLVELIRGARTSDDTLAAARAFAEAAGKTTISVRDVPGFATSRLDLIAALEAIRMLEDGVASADDIDRAMLVAYRHPIGPLRLSDLVGLDVRLDIARQLSRTLGPRYDPPKLLEEMVARSDLGAKTGKGFFDWTKPEEKGRFNAMASMFNSTLVDTADHHGMLRDSVGKLVGGFGRRYFQDVVKRKEKPEALWNAMAEAGFLGVHISEEYGGSGSGLADYNVIVEETAAQGCPILSLVIGSICAPIIEQHASDDIKKLWLPGLASGKLRLAFAITEPDAGSNTHKVSTIARRDGNGWSLKGTKSWTSAVDEVDAIMVVARGETLDAQGRGQLSIFIVPPDAEGISKTPIETVLHVPETQFMLYFDDVKLPADALVGQEGQGLKHLFSGLNPERVCAAAINNGIARYALEKGASYAAERSVWKTPIGAHQGVAHPLAKAYVGVQQARLMTARAAQLYDQGSPEAGEAANRAKFAAADASLEALDQAIQTHGGNGLATEYGLAELWFIARLHKTAPVSREMVLNFIAQHSLGLPKSY